MPADELKIHARPSMQAPRMVMGFSGWMDGGDVSTGTIEALVERLDAQVLAEIEGEDFYIQSFPGSMEVSALFRPYAKIEDGLITAFQGPTNTFFHCAPQRLILFSGREPNLRWRRFCDCILEVASAFGVCGIYFVGSVAGLVPHTREPRLHSSVSAPAVKESLRPFPVRFTNYEGPASLITYLTRRSAEAGIPMASLVAEIPAYVHGKNHRCIAAMIRQLAGILNLKVNLDDLRVLGDQLEERLNEIVKEHPDLLERIRKLETDYDNEVFDTEMGDLKDWLQQKGIRLD